MTDHGNDHDDEFDERRLLASAYVDGEATAEERARAEGDAEVMAHVEVMRDVRRRLAVTDPPDPSRRDAAISAAMGAPADSVAPRVPSVAARRRARWLAPVAAAAALVLVVAGLAALIGDGTDDASTVDELGDEAGVTAGLAESELDVQAPAATAAGGAATLTTAVAELDTSASERSQVAEETTAAATDGTAAGTAPEDANILRSQDDLRAFAAGSVPDGERTSGAGPTCRDDELIGVASAQAVDGAVVDVEVYAVEEPPELVAVDRATCEVVLRASR